MGSFADARWLDEKGLGSSDIKRRDAEFAVQSSEAPASFPHKRPGRKHRAPAIRERRGWVPFLRQGRRDDNGGVKRPEISLPPTRELSR